MSFPYTITSPPPTSGILSIVGEANSSSGPYGSGSGPGPSPPTDPITASSIICVSSLSFPNSQTQGAIYISTQLTFCDLGQLSNSFLNISNAPDTNGNQVGTLDLKGSYGLGEVGLWGSSDGTAGIYSGFAPQDGNPPSTLTVYADNVLMSTLTISSINGATFPQKAVLPEDAGFNTLECSTLGVNTTISVGGFPQPVITFGATTLNGSGTAKVTLDRTYADPYYPFLTYRGTLGATTSTLSVSTIDGTSFNVYGEANTQVQYMVCGN